MARKNVYIIAGPNGSGKTTFARKFLPKYANCRNFVNADLIAQGLSPFSPQMAAMKAGRLVLDQVHELAEKGEDFAFETTLAGKAYISFLKQLKRKGYYISLFFLWIPNTELALARIKERVSEGGHDVPAVDVRRRFSRSLYNLFEYYKPLLDSLMIFDNSGAIPNLIAEERGGKISVIDNDVFDKLTRIKE